MVRACLPKKDAKQAWFATGSADPDAPRMRPGDKASELEPLDEDNDVDNAREEMMWF